jgi:hypothetical protein
MAPMHGLIQHTETETKQHHQHRLPRPRQRELELIKSILADSFALSICSTSINDTNVVDINVAFAIVLKAVSEVSQRLREHAPLHRQCDHQGEISIINTSILSPSHAASRITSITNRISIHGMALCAAIEKVQAQLAQLRHPRRQPRSRDPQRIATLTTLCNSHMIAMQFAYLNISSILYAASAYTTTSACTATFITKATALAMTSA